MSLALRSLFLNQTKGPVSDVLKGKTKRIMARCVLGGTEMKDVYLDWSE
jgi:hypothetical protein